MRNLRNGPDWRDSSILVWKTHDESACINFACAWSRQLRVLIAHNRYQVQGGEDAVVANETALLRAHGFEVESLTVDNLMIEGVAGKLKTAMQVTYSWAMRARLAKLLQAFQPDLMHVHNFFPLLSPSIYDAAFEAGCPVVQTIHNFRLLCLNGTLFRDGHVCLDCVEKDVPWPGVRHRCYRNSLAGSASVALMLAVNRMRGAWSRRVARLLLLTPFARELLLKYTTIPEAKMRLKPNAAPDLSFGPGDGGYALYAGRLSPEKGIEVLLAAAEQGLGMPLKIAGHGPLQEKVLQAAAAGRVEYLGSQQPSQVAALMRSAACLLLPSLWYEGLPMVIPEAFSAGLPVIASDIGSLSSLVEQERTGLLVPPGDPAQLAAACVRIGTSALRNELRTGARSRYLSSYQPKSNFELLQGIYEEVVEEATSSRRLLTSPRGT